MNVVDWSAPAAPNGGSLTLSVQEIADEVQGTVAGDGSVPIAGVASITDAEAGDIVFAESPSFLGDAERSRASAIVAFPDAAVADKPVIRVDNPRFAFSRVLALFSPRMAPPIGVHPSAVVGERAAIARTASVGPHVSIGDDVVIGDRAIVLAGCRIGDRVRIGEDCIIHPNVVIYPGCLLGARVVIHAGVIIGADGFGFVRIGGMAHKVPHIGTVVIEDDVEVGANSTIDRAKTGTTVIGARTKIDNLVQIAHNVKVGSDCIIAALVGIAGSATLGKGVIMAGQVGVRDHVRIGDGAVVLGQTGVWGDLDAGSLVSGSPAKPHRQRLREMASAERGPEAVRKVGDLMAEIARMRARLEALERNGGQPADMGHRGR